MKSFMRHVLMATTAMIVATPLSARSQTVAPVGGSNTAPTSPGQPAPAAGAGSNAQAVNSVQEIVVTANKRPERLQDVAQTVSVVDAAQLNSLNIREFQDIQTTVAGLSLSRDSGNEQSISLRGVKMPGFSGAATTNTVEPYLDEVPIRVTDVFNSIYDLSQVEVLSGPQGTLRGLTSPSGAILIGTAKPDFNRVQGYIDTTLTTLSGYNVQGAINMPISSTLAVRVAGLYDSNDGNDVRDIVNGKRSNNETGSGRITVAWHPISNLHIEVMNQELHNASQTYRSLDGVGTAASQRLGWRSPMTIASRSIPAMTATSAICLSPRSTPDLTLAATG